MLTPINAAVAKFGDAVRAKLNNLGPKGEPEDQLRAPLEILLQDVALLYGFTPGDVVATGETSLATLRTRPDYSVSVRQIPVGFIEVKAPGKGGDPSRYRDKHDKEQWAKLRSLPNVLYTDGQEFTLWQNGIRVGEVMRLVGDITSAGSNVQAPSGLFGLLESFLSWHPLPPLSVKDIARTSARLCHYLRDEVTELMSLTPGSLEWIRDRWRKSLFPEVDPKTDDANFADGYAQAVTFGLLVARAKGISLDQGIGPAARALGNTNSVIGAALRALTEEAEAEHALSISTSTLTRVLGVVDWSALSKDRPEAWLYFYEEFLDVYDKKKRQDTGSYYTPPEVVKAMVRLVDEALQSSARFDLPRGFATKGVSVVDPAVGTGTYLLGILARIAETARQRSGAGTVYKTVREALGRTIGFEMQFGPFAVAQLRLLAEVTELTKGEPDSEGPLPPLRLFVTNTLDDPNIEVEALPGILKPIGESRREANEVKRSEAITVVIGNPPYKEKMKGKGAWVERALLPDWIPPTNWKVGTHAKHLRNLYVYFWRWATWKVFDQDPAHSTGIVAYITVAGFLNGPGFQRMRADLRVKADEIWVIDCTPEGIQPDVATRIFQGVQQTVCIVIAVRNRIDAAKGNAVVRYRALPLGPREAKFAALGEIGLDGDGWSLCSDEDRAPFLPASGVRWAAFVPLERFFLYDGSGVMPGRTWVIAPDAESLQRRWETLQSASKDSRDALFHPHEGGDKEYGKSARETLHGYEARRIAVAKDTGAAIPPVRYAFRSFDRQWIFPDARLINRPNPTLWNWHTGSQIYLTALQAHSPSAGPAFTFAGEIPDLDHYSGRGGRVFPLYRRDNAPNIRPALLAFLVERYGRDVSPEDLVAYLAAIGSHPAFTTRFQEDLVQPGLRLPLTADGDLFAEAAKLGKRVIWLQTYGERLADPAAGRPRGAPRPAPDRVASIPADGAIPDDADEIDHDGVSRLLVGGGVVENVSRRSGRTRSRANASCVRGSRTASGTVSGPLSPGAVPPRL